MPKYDFICKNNKCKDKTTQEIPYFNFHTTLDSLKCEKCGWRLQRVYKKTPTIQFTGKGFYSTDNKKGEKNEGNATKQNRK